MTILLQSTPMTILLLLLLLHQLPHLASTTFQFPISLDGVITQFTAVISCSDQSGNAFRQTIREFCVLHRLKYNDCLVLLHHLEQEASTHPCVKDPSLDLSHFFSSSSLQWSGNGNGDLFFVQLLSPSVLNHLSLGDLDLKFDSRHESPNQFGRTMKRWRFVRARLHDETPETPVEREYSFLLDDVLDFEGTTLHIITPNSNGDEPFSPINPQDSTLALVFDGSDHAESVQQYLQRCSDLLRLIRHHRQRGQREIGLIIVGDKNGLFPLSIYNLVDWSMRQYYFGDQMEGNDVLRPPLWLPLSPLVVAKSVSMFEDKNDNNDDERDILLLAVLNDEDDTTTQTLLCGRGTAETEDANDSDSDDTYNDLPPRSSRRCYKSWQEKGINEAIQELQLREEKSGGNVKRFHRIRKNNPNIVSWMKRSVFVVGSTEHLSTGSESRVMWTALKHGAVPIIAGPAHQLGLAEFGKHHPLPEVNPTKWRSELVNIVEPYLSSSNSSNNNNNNTKKDHRIVLLRRRVALWHKKFQQQMSCKHLFATTTTTESNPSFLSIDGSVGTHPFEHLLESYVQWNKYHASFSSVNPSATPSATSTENAAQRDSLGLSVLQTSYRAALVAIEKFVAPPPLRIFALENIAATEQIEGMLLQEQGIMGWQKHNRRSLIAISEALRIVLGEFSTERILFPWLPKLLIGAGALSWNLGAFRSAERITQEALGFNPMSVQYFEQLIKLWRQMRDRGWETHDARRNGSIHDVVKKEETLPVDPIDQVARHARFLWNSSGYADGHWSVPTSTVVKKWWRYDELEIKNTAKDSQLVEGRRQEEHERFEHDQDHSTENIVSILEKKNVVPMEHGDLDAVDELMWLLDREDTSPLMVLLEMSGIDY